MIILLIIIILKKNSSENGNLLPGVYFCWPDSETLVWCLFFLWADSLFSASNMHHIHMPQLFPYREGHSLILLKKINKKGHTKKRKKNMIIFLFFFRELWKFKYDYSKFGLIQP